MATRHGLGTVVVLRECVAITHALQIGANAVMRAVMGATMARMSFAPLIELTRGGTPESLHFGAVAAVDARGKLLAAVGDPRLRVFTRSTLKALQALPFVRGGGPAQFGFSPPQLALLCASHSGEPMHVEQVQGMLDKAGVDYRQLQCGCHVPMFVELGVGPAPAAVDERHHNCSGKHAGFLAYCVQHGQLPGRRPPAATGDTP
jgi:L-asparaginase II